MNPKKPKIIKSYNKVNIYYPHCENNEKSIRLRVTIFKCQTINLSVQMVENKLGTECNSDQSDKIRTRLTKLS